MVEVEILVEAGVLIEAGNLFEVELEVGVVEVVRVLVQE